MNATIRSPTLIVRLFARPSLTEPRRTQHGPPLQDCGPAVGPGRLDLGLAHAAGAPEEEQNHEQPRPLPASPSVYLRVPYGAGASVPSPAEIEPASMPIFALPAIAERDAPPSNTIIAAPELREATRGASELWLVSTRRLPKPGDNAVSPDFSPDVYRYVGGGWVPSSLAEFLRSDDPGVVTSIFIHGNDTDAAYAAGGGGNLYVQLLAGARPGCAAHAIRHLVVAQRANDPPRSQKRTGKRLANQHRGLFPRRVSPRPAAACADKHRRLQLGRRRRNRRAARVGRRNAGRSQPGVAPVARAAFDRRGIVGRGDSQRLAAARQAIRTCLVSGQANGDHGQSVDGVLQWYSHLWGRGGAEALGATGVTNASQLGPEQTKLVQVDLQALCTATTAGDITAARPRSSRCYETKCCSSRQHRFAAIVPWPGGRDRQPICVPMRDGRDARFLAFPFGYTAAYRQR